MFDSKVEAHHHFIDDETGRIYDLPWETISVSGEDSLTGFTVREYQVVMRGKVAGRRTRKKGQSRNGKSQ